MLRWGAEGIDYEPDQRHPELTISELGLEHATPVTTPGTREEFEWGEEKSPELKPSEATSYRGVAARFKYLSQDRADIQFACKEASRGEARPAD